MWGSQPCDLPKKPQLAIPTRMLIPKPPSRVDTLKTVWTAANAEERSEFLTWALSPAIATSPSSSPTPEPIADHDRRLTPGGIARIHAAMIQHGWRDEDGRNKLKALMEELGGKKLDASIGRAMFRGSRLQQGLLDTLQNWLEAEERK